MSRFPRISPQLYRMRDVGTYRPAIPVSSEAEARRYNTVEQRFGIFRPVQLFDGPCRREDRLVRVIAWAIDLDHGDKADQLARLMGGPLLPSGIIETRRGYQAKWFAIDGDRESFGDVMDRLVAFYGADKNAKDLCRILRVPTYWHHKAEPFLVRLVHRADVAYSPREMRNAYPEVVRPVPSVIATRRPSNDLGAGFYDELERLDQRYVLESISGTWLVGGETFAFVRSGRGKYNLIVDGRVTSNWIDSAGRIGATPSPGRKDSGPYASQWLRWYGHTDSDIRRGLIEFVPELRRFAREGRHAA